MRITKLNITTVATGKLWFYADFEDVPG